MKVISAFAMCFVLLGGLLMFADASGAASNLPPGSYKKTCKDLRLTDKGLHGVCQMRNGKWRKTFIPASEMACPNGIENLDGELVCPRG